MQRVNIELVDDIDGSLIESESAGATITFSLEGANYEIDLTNENRGALREVLAPYIAAARLTKRRGPAAKSAAGVKRQARQSKS